MKKALLLLGLSICCIQLGYSQAGKLDSSFGGVGWVKEDFVKINSYFESVLQILLQKNGSYYLVIGLSERGPYALARYHANGTLDKRYGKEGYLIMPDIATVKVAQQSNGMIIVAGSSANYTASLARYNTDGSLDNTFGEGGRLNTDFKINIITLQSDGKIVVIGETYPFQFRTNIIVRYNSDGTPDNTFKLDESLRGSTFNNIIEVQKGQEFIVSAIFYRLVICGGKCSYFIPENILIRLNNDGSLDQGFGNNGQIPTQGSLIAVLNDGKIIVVSTKGNAVVPTRYNRDGSIDTEFNTDGEQPADFRDGIFPASVAVLKNGKIIIIGSTGASQPSDSKDFAVIRYNKNGTLDKSFDEDGKVVTDFGFNDYANAVAVQNNGKLFVAGGTTSTGNWDYALAWYNYDGSPDDKFYAAGIKVGFIPVGVGALNNIAFQRDGKKIVAGYCYDSLNHYRFFVARYNKNGSPDKTFSDDGKQTTDFGFGDAYLYSLAIQKDGRIVVAGSVYSDQLSYFAIARYKTDGTLDSTFSEDGTQVTSFGDNYPSNYATSLAIQQDGKVVLAGTVYGLEGYGSLGIVRYSTDGSLDNSFDNDGKLVIKFNSSYSYGSSVCIQKDQKIVVAGSAGIDYYHDFAITRLNQDGTLDHSFGIDGILLTDIAGTDDYVRSVAIQNDGKIIVAGRFSNILINSEGGVQNTDIDFAITRYNTDGSLDNSFDSDGKLTTDFGYYDAASSINLQEDGKIIVTGSGNYQFTSGSDIFNARYNSDGTLDSSFGTNGKVITDFGDNESAEQASIHDNNLYVTANFFGKLQGSIILAYTLLGTSELAPNVSISTPGEIVSFSAPAAIKLTAIASSQESKIKKVQFFNGATLLKTDKKYPYQVSWMNVPQGIYTFTARVTDARGLSASSYPLVVEVKAAASAVLTLQKNNTTSSLVTDMDEPMNIKISPNPTSGVLAIQTTKLEWGSQATISVISSTGVIIKTIRLSTSAQLIQLDLTRLKSGLYIVKFANGNKTFYKQFVKL